jgi:hypothetical protein
VQSLYYDDLVFGRERARELVDGVAAEIGRAGMDPSQLTSSSSPSARIGLAASELTV